jgi:tRNA pseudouridine38-40 synthase
MRIALGIEYDGSGFLGWQTQPGGGGVQDALERALAAIAGQQVKVVGAGRTDRGVHARGQVAHFETEALRPDTAWVRGVNAMLPDGVAVLWACQAGAEFHARYSARARVYRYVLLSRPVRPALFARNLGWFHASLDVDAMRAAATMLAGKHDFSAFRSAECQARSPVRTLEALTIEQQGERIDFVFRADAFLHHMVRNIVGALVYVGKGKHPPQWVSDVLASRDRALGAPTFSPEGLYLERVEYDARWQLPQAPLAPLALPTLPAISAAP